MAMIKMKPLDSKRHQRMSDAIESYLKRCKIKNLSERTQEYYAENLEHFCKVMPHIQYADEITQDVLDSFVLKEMDRKNRVTSINSRLRGIYAFLRFCFKQEYSQPFPLSLLKEDEIVKDPYTDEELKRLLKQPTSENWIEWRTWAAINMLVATGIRATTIVSIKISDIDFETNEIRLRRLKNRKQQFIPLCNSLSEILKVYLKVWDWDDNDYLFPSRNKTQLQPHSMGQSIREYEGYTGIS